MNEIPDQLYHLNRCKAFCSAISNYSPALFTDSLWVLAVMNSQRHGSYQPWLALAKTNSKYSISPERQYINEPAKSYEGEINWLNQSFKQPTNQQMHQSIEPFSNHGVRKVTRELAQLIIKVLIQRSIHHKQAYAASVRSHEF